MTRNSRWCDLPDSVKVRMAETMRARKADTQWRREERKRLGVGRNLSKLVRIHRDSLQRLKALSHMRRGLALIQDVELESVGHKFSLCEEVRRLVNAQWRRMIEQLEYLASDPSGDGRAEMVLEKAHMLDAGWQ